MDNNWIVVAVVIVLQEFMAVLCHTTYGNSQDRTWWYVVYGIMSAIAPALLVSMDYRWAYPALLHPVSQWYAAIVWECSWWRTPLWRNFSDRWHLLAWGRHLTSAILIYLSSMPWWGAVAVALACEVVWFSVKRLILKQPWPMLWQQLWRSFRGK